MEEEITFDNENNVNLENNKNKPHKATEEMRVVNNKTRKLRSGRTIKTPSYFKDYEQYDNYCILSYREAITGANQEKWKIAIKEDL